MSKLNINRLVIKTDTYSGLFGADLRFFSGLNVISAENSFGKSTCIQSIIFALGLEGVLGPSRNNPLKSALTTKLRDENDKEVLIKETEVYLEISNELGDVITLLRQSDIEASKIITVFNSDIDNIQKNKFTDFFLKDPGSAQRERGFHHFLSEFLGIKQPEVMKYDGSKSILYLESIFTVNYVEQTRGWGGILNVIPTYLGIKDLSQNILEYTLDLDVREIRRKRESYIESKKRQEARWTAALGDLISTAKIHGFFVSNRLPENIGNKIEVMQDSDLYTFNDSQMEVSLSNDIASKEYALSSLQLNRTSTLNQNRKDISDSIDAIKLALKNHENALGVLISDLDLNYDYFNSITKSLTNTKESLRKYRDIEKLQQLGSQEQFNLSEDNCPTCGQSLQGTLLPNTIERQALSIEENIKYLEKTQTVFESLSKSERKKIKDKELLIKSSNSKVRELRSELGAIQRSLMSPGDASVREQIRQEVILEKKIETLYSLLDFEKDIKTTLSAVLIEWKKINSELSRLPYDGFTYEDKRKINKLKVSFKENLKDFGYKSTDIEDFELSMNTYKPSLDDVDIGSEASASDNIRVIWSYLYSLLMLDTALDGVTTNHLGLLIMDEPRQQETKDVSFKKFIKKASETECFNKQIIFGTSEKFEDLTKMIDGVKVNMIHFDHSIIRKIQLDV
ncbi:hypothetical protein ACWXVW_05260 [Pantoea dispersa]